MKENRRGGDLEYSMGEGGGEGGTKSGKMESLLSGNEVSCSL